MVRFGEVGREGGWTRRVVLAAGLLAFGLGGECRWSFRSGDDDDKERRPKRAVSQPITMVGSPVQVVCVPGGRALLYSSIHPAFAPGSAIVFGGIRWLDLETGHSIDLVDGFGPPSISSVDELGFEYATPFVGGCRYDFARRDVGLEAGPVAAGKAPASRSIEVRGRTLRWIEGDRVAEVRLLFDAEGAVFDPHWSAPLAWHRAGDLLWVDLDTGAGIPAVPRDESAARR